MYFAGKARPPVRPMAGVRRVRQFMVRQGLLSMCLDEPGEGKHGEPGVTNTTQDERAGDLRTSARACTAVDRRPSCQSFIRAMPCVARQCGTQGMKRHGGMSGASLAVSAIQKGRSCPDGVSLTASLPGIQTVMLMRPQMPHCAGALLELGDRKGTSYG